MDRRTDIDTALGGVPTQAEEKPSFLSRLVRANKKISEAREQLKYEDLSPYVDPKKVTFENIDKLNQVELFALLDKNTVPTKSLLFLGFSTLAYFSYMTYLVIKRGPQYMSRVTQNRPKNLGTMIIVGTRITAQVFLGYALMAAPILYFTDLLGAMERNGQIRTRLGNSIIINDDQLQEFMLFQTMRYFNLSEDLIGRTKEELKVRKERMDRETASLDSIVARLESAHHVKRKVYKNRDEDL